MSKTRNDSYQQYILFLGNISTIYTVYWSIYISFVSTSFTLRHKAIHLKHDETRKFNRVNYLVYLVRGYVDEELL